MGMNPKDYEYLLMAADLGHLNKRWGFTIKIMKWKDFFEGHWFTTINCNGTFEVDVKKKDLNAFSRESLPSTGRRCTSFGLVYSMPLLPEKLRCRRIQTMAG
jgi:hypothetical protein